MLRLQSRTSHRPLLPGGDIDGHRGRKTDTLLDYRATVVKRIHPSQPIFLYTPIHLYLSELVTPDAEVVTTRVNRVDFDSPNRLLVLEVFSYLSLPGASGMNSDLARLPLCGKPQSGRLERFAAWP